MEQDDVVEGNGVNDVKLRLYLSLPPYFGVVATLDILLFLLLEMNYNLRKEEKFPASLKALLSQLDAIKKSIKKKEENRINGDDTEVQSVRRK